MAGSKRTFAAGVLAAIFLIGASGLTVFASWRIRDATWSLQQSTFQAILVIDDLSLTALNMQEEIAPARLSGNRGQSADARPAFAHFAAAYERLRRIESAADILVRIDGIQKNLQGRLGGNRKSSPPAAGGTDLLSGAEVPYQEIAALLCALKELKQRHTHRLSEGMEAIAASTTVLVASSLLALICGMLLSVLAFSAFRDALPRTPAGPSIQLFEDGE